MRPEVARLYELAHRADQIADAEQLTEAVVKATAALGFSSVSVNLIVTPGKLLRPGILVGHCWREWSDRYARERFALADPAVRMLRTQTRLFTWSEAVKRFGSKVADRVMCACRETTGAAEALVVPVRESDGALLSAAFCGDAVDPDPEVRAALHLTGYYYATRGRELVQAIALDARSPLTPRQVECLQLVLIGKTDDEIGRILGLTPCIAMWRRRSGVSAFKAWSGRARRLTGLAGVT